MIRLDWTLPGGTHGRSVDESDVSYEIVGRERPTYGSMQYCDGFLRVACCELRAVLPGRHHVMISRPHGSQESPGLEGQCRGGLRSGHTNCMEG